jgi:hypothetical protein
MVNNNILKYCYTNSSGLHQVSFYSWSCIIDINNCYSYSYSQFIHDTFILFLIYIYTHSHYPLSLSYFHVWWIWLRIFYYLLWLWNELIHVSTIYTYNYRYSSNKNNSHNGHINHMEVSQNIGTPKHGLSHWEWALLDDFWGTPMTYKSLGYHHTYLTPRNYTVILNVYHRKNVLGATNVQSYLGNGNNLDFSPRT